jgi:hypothetical protein
MRRAFARDAATSRSGLGMHSISNDGALEFSEPVDLTDIEAIIDADDDQPITLWTMQQPGFLVSLGKEEVLTGNEDYAFGSFDAPGKRGAYRWLQQQLADRVPGYGGRLPVWTLLTKPSFTLRSGDKLLRLRVDRARATFIWYKPWLSLLAFMRTPERGVLLSDALNYAFQQERDEREANLHVMPPRAEILALMPRMFDLWLAREPGFLWMVEGTVLQAVVEEIAFEDVISIEDIEQRAA